MLFAHINLSQVYSGIFQRLHDMWYCNRVKTEAYLWIQLPSFEPDIKETWENVNNATLLIEKESFG